MFKIYEIIHNHNLTSDEFLLCLDATFKKSKAEEYKKNYLVAKEQSSSLDPQEVPEFWKTDFALFTSLMALDRNCVLHMYYKKSISQNIEQVLANGYAKKEVAENIFYIFLLMLTTSYYFNDRRCGVLEYFPTFTLLRDYYRLTTGEMYNYIRSYDDKLTTHLNRREEFQREFIKLDSDAELTMSKNIKRVLKAYLSLYQEKKIKPTLEALKEYDLHVALVKKLIEFDWLGLTKIEDDFKYIISFIYIVKLYLLIAVGKEVIDLQIRNPQIHTTDLQYKTVQRILNYEKQNSTDTHIGIFNDNETPEEFVVRCADYFGIKAEEEVKSVVDKQTQVKEKQIIQAYSEVLKSKMEEPKAE